MDLGLKNKTALVLGASQGLGEGIARTLAAEGCNLVLASRNVKALSDLAAELAAAHGITASFEKVDMTDKASVAALAEKNRTRGDIDILVNNAGGPPPSLSTGVSDDIWENAVQSLLLSVIRVTESVLDGMKSRNWGRVLTIASSGVIQPIPNLAVSNIVRGAIVGFSKTLSAEVGPHGITSNIIVPGKIDTARVGQLDNARAKRENKSYDEVRTSFEATIPAGRYGRVEEFADAAVFLLSERAGYISGQMTRVDGGAIKSV